MDRQAKHVHSWMPAHSDTTRFHPFDQGALQTAPDGALSTTFFPKNNTTTTITTTTTILYHTILYYIILYILYCTILYYIILYCTNNNNNNVVYSVWSVKQISSHHPTPFPLPLHSIFAHNNKRTSSAAITPGTVLSPLSFFPFLIFPSAPAY
ncbi:hypothetical protein VTO42DRAFT_4867 [Malbranchea cinnamomea]